MVFSYQSKLLGERTPASPTSSFASRHGRNSSVSGVRGQWEARVQAQEGEKRSSVGGEKRLSSLGEKRSSSTALASGVSGLIASPSRREFRSEYLVRRKDGDADGASSRYYSFADTDLLADDREATIRDTLNRLTGITKSPESDTSLESEEPSPIPSPDLSPPRFLHHLAPDIEYDLSKSRSRPALDDADDPLDLFGAHSSGLGGVRKRMSNPLLGEPYYPNPNPVKGWRERERERKGLGVHREVCLSFVVFVVDGADRVGRRRRMRSCPYQ
jgi:hypothetical protein